VSVLAKKLLGVAVGVVIVGVLIGFYIATWATSFPQSVAAISTRKVAGFSGTQLTLQTVASIGPNSLVHVTVYQFDGDSGLRNPFLSQAQGTTTGTITIDGKAVRGINPEEASHTFAVPQLGLFIPLPGVPEEAKNQCEFAPCLTSEAHRTITFTFRTGKKGRYRWQCFVPCAAGWIFGQGGPMQTLGYMDGFLDVV
jgi:hypothetical protein